MPKNERDRLKNIFLESCDKNPDERTEEEQAMHSLLLNPIYNEFRPWEMYTPIAHKVRIIVVLISIPFLLFYGYEYIFILLSIIGISIGASAIFIFFVELKKFKKMKVNILAVGVSFLTFGVLYFILFYKWLILGFFLPKLISIIYNFFYEKE